MCRYRYFLSNVSMYRYNTVSILFKSIWYRYMFNQFLALISVFIAFLCDNFCRNSKVTVIMFKNNVKRFLKCEILSIMENFYFWFDKNLNFLEYFGQKGVKYYQKKYRQHKMYWYTDTFSMKNVSMCRYRYILKVSDTDTVSNTKGLTWIVLEVNWNVSKYFVLRLPDPKLISRNSTLALGFLEHLNPYQ